MAFRDMSAFTTLDNANMTTREEFKKTCEEWSPHKRNVNDELFGYDFRQPEIDALKHRFEEANKLIVEWMEKCKELKVENERLREVVERLEDDRWNAALPDTKGE